MSTNPILSIVIDQREPDSIKGLDYGAPVAVALLDAGDAWIACQDAMLVVERKTSADLCNSISDGRLLDQCVRMRQLSPWAYLVITGNVLWEQTGPGAVIQGYQATGWNMRSVWGALLTVQELGVHLIFAQNEEDYPACLRRLAGRERGEIRIAPARPPRILSPGEQVLSALPGIGWERVGALLEFCGTPAWALSYLTRLGENGVNGIGDGIKRGIRRALELPDDLELHVIAKEN